MVEGEKYNEVGTLGRKWAEGTAVWRPANARILKTFSAALMSANQQAWPRVSYVDIYESAHHG